ncbi:MAG: hypothetical protein ABIA63_14300, partial [bacterium]
VGIAVNHTNEFMRDVFLDYSDSTDFLYAMRYYSQKADSLKSDTLAGAENKVLMPIAETDVFAAYGLENLNLGLHLFLADNLISSDKEISTKLIKGDLGIVYNFSKDFSAEAALGLGNIRANYDFKKWWTEKNVDTVNALGDSIFDTTLTRTEMTNRYENLYSIYFQSRAILKLGKKNSLIPLLKWKNVNGLDGLSRNIMGGGLGLTRSLYRGMVWTGGEYLYSKSKYNTNRSQYSVSRNELSGHNIQISFGIEKQMIWEWFMLRVGATKAFVFEKHDQENYKEEMETIRQTLEENKDVVGFGIALIPNEQLQFDVTASQQFPYSNVFSDSRNGLLVTRISATYKF